MKIVVFKNGPAAIGLDWFVLSGKLPERKGIKALLEQNRGVKFGLVVKFGGVALLGMVPPEEKAPKAPSAAAWVALANQSLLDKKQSPGDTTGSSGESNDWIVIENLGDGRYWFLVVREGLPLPGTDILVDQATAVSLLNEALATQNPFIVFSNDADIRDEALGAVRIEAKDFAEIVSGIKPTKAQIKALTGISSTVVLVLLFLVLAGGLWWGYSMWQARQQRLAAEAAAQAAATQQAASLKKDQAAYNLAVQQAILTALKTGVTKVNQSLATPAPGDVLGAWSDMVEGTSINHAGWELGGFACSIEEIKPTCVITLKRGPFGINRLLMQDHPDAVLEGDSATYKIQGTDLVARPTKIGDLTQAASFNENFVSELQMLRLATVSYNLGASTEISEPVVMPPKPASMFKPGSTPDAPAKAVSVQLGVSSGVLTLNGGKVWQLRGMREFLAGNNLAVVASTIAASRADTGAWSMTVNYYIRSRPEPTLPSVLVGDTQVITVPLPSEYKASAADLAAANDGAVKPSVSAPIEAPKPVSAPKTPVNPNPPASPDLVPTNGLPQPVIPPPIKG
jgi:hypothetical protein